MRGSVDVRPVDYGSMKRPHRKPVGEGQNELESDSPSRTFICKRISSIHLTCECDSMGAM